MAQGAVKKSNAPTKSSRPKRHGPTPGSKVIKPKKTKLLARGKLLKVGCHLCKVTSSYD
jgi:hypothetical protein